MTFLTKFSIGKKHSKEAFRFDPSRDWLLLLSGATILFIGVFLWNVWLFQTVANGGTLGEAPVANAPVFKQSALESARALFISRAAEEEKYISGVYHFADPSQ